MNPSEIRSFPEVSDNAGELIHSPFYPADVRVGDPVEATLQFKTSTGPKEVCLDVWKLSPFGVELVEKATELDLAVGAELDLTLKLGRQSTQFRGLVVQTRHRSQTGKSLLGIRWQQSNIEIVPDENRRKAQRWMCGSEFLPTGVSANPVRFNDFVHFRIRELSKDGLQLLTSLRNKFIVPGMRLDAVVSFPTVGQVRMDFQIVHARVVGENGKDYLLLGSKLLNPSPGLKQTMAQYILQFGPPTSIEELRSADLHVESGSRAVDFGYVRTAEEYRQVLELRKLAYTAANKMSKDIQAEQTADIFDSRSRILIGRYRGDVVASMRLMFHEPSDLFEHEQYVKFPDDFPPRNEIIEITRVCTHPAYRGSDLLLSLFKQAVLMSVQSKRNYMLGSATAKLLPMYEKLGFKVTDIRYRHEALGGDEHLIFLGDIRRVLSGDGVGPLIWNSMFAGIWNYLDLRNYVEVTPVVSTRLALYRLCRPLTEMLVRRMNKPRAAKQRGP